MQVSLIHEDKSKHLLKKAGFWEGEWEVWGWVHMDNICALCAFFLTWGIA